MKKNIVLPIDVIQDSRENKPFTFAPYQEVNVSVATLKAGDYTLVQNSAPQDRYSVMIERKKDCAELVSNLGRNWDRFEKQLSLLSEYHVKYIIVGSNNNFQELFNRNLIKANPKFLESRLMDIRVKYGIPIMFFPNKNLAEEFVYNIFRKINKLTYD